MTDKCKTCKSKCKSECKGDITKKPWKANLKEKMRMIKMLKETMSHDRKTCDCEACHLWVMVNTVFQNGRLFEIVRSWDEIDDLEFMRSQQRFLNYQIDKQLPKKELVKILIKKKKLPKDVAEKVAEQMLQAMFTVFYKAPQMGVMREI